MTIDTERLIKDLRAGAAVSMAGDEAIAPVSWGMARGWLILAAAIEEGEYDLDPKVRIIAEVDPDWDLPQNMFPGYDSDDLDKIVAEKDREENR